MVKSQWAMIMEMMENFPKFIGSNIDFEKWGMADWANWLEKLRQLSPNTDNIDFNEMQTAFMVRKQWDYIRDNHFHRTSSRTKMTSQNSPLSSTGTTNITLRTTQCHKNHTIYLALQIAWGMFSHWVCWSTWSDGDFFEFLSFSWLLFYIIRSELI